MCVCVYLCVCVCEMIVEEMWKAAGKRADQPEWLGLNQSSFFFLIDAAGCINGRESSNVRKPDRTRFWECTTIYIHTMLKKSSTHYILSARIERV